MDKISTSNIPAPFFIIQNDANFTIIYANKEFYDFINRDKDEIYTNFSNKLITIINPDDINTFKESLSNNSKKSTLHFRKKDGAIIYAEIFIKKLENNTFSCIAHNITNYFDKNLSYDELKDKYYFLTSKSKSITFQYFPENNQLIYYLPEKDTKIEVKNFPDSLIENEIIHPDSVNDVLSMFNDIRYSKSYASCEAKIKDDINNRYLWLMICINKNNYNNKTVYNGFASNISWKKESTMAYLRKTRAYQAIISECDASAQVNVTKNKLIKATGLWSTYQNNANELTYEDIAFKYVDMVVHHLDKNQYKYTLSIKHLASSHENGISKLHFEFRRIIEENKMMWMRLTIHLFSDPFTNNLIAILCLNNIDTEKKNELLLQQESRRDHLTNCYNRRMLERSIIDYLNGNKNPFVFAILDIDNFKILNDTYGHLIGDKILVKFVNILKKFLSKSDIIGRFGGDEFIVLIKNIASKEKVEEIFKNIITTFSKDCIYSVTCSIGAIIEKENISYNRLFKCADIALYTAKNKGKNTYSFYDITSDAEYLKNDECNNRNIEIYTQEPRILKSPTFDSLLNENGDIAYLVDINTFELIDANQSFYNRIGLTKDECTGSYCYELLYNRKTPCPFCSKLNWREDKFYIWKNYNNHLEQEFIIKNKLVKYDNSLCMLAIAIDISNNKNIADFADYNTNAERILLNCIYNIAETTTLDSSIETSLNAIAQFYKADTVEFWEKTFPNGNYIISSIYNEIPYDDNKLIKYERLMAEFLVDYDNLLVETAEDMLQYSCDIYQYMTTENINNMRIIELSDRNNVYGKIVIRNIKSFHKYQSFLDSVSFFILKEIQKYNSDGTIEYMRHHDVMTNLLNRLSYDEFVSKYNPNKYSSIGIISVNINDLRKINTKYGQEEGNRVLKEVADLLNKYFYGYNIYRIGGDEFIVIAKDISKEKFEENCINFKNKLSTINLYSVAVGYIWDNKEKNLEMLLWHSNELMKINKQLYHYNGQSINDNPRYAILNELLTSIDKGNFIVYYQPKKDIVKNSIAGAEALIRYKDNGKIVPPADFLKLYEDNGMARFIDFFVFEEVCKLLKEIEEKNYNQLKISVNFSKMTLFESNFIIILENIVNKYNLNKKFLEIEITESISDLGSDVLSRITQDLKNNGFSVSLDDFGMMHSNLSTLVNITFDVIKLDKSLVNSICDNNSNRIIIKNIINMCSELGSETIAEGIETKEQEELLSKLGCRYFQGYLYDKPIPLDKFKEKYLIK